MPFGRPVESKSKLSTEGVAASSGATSSQEAFSTTSNTTLESSSALTRTEAEAISPGLFTVRTSVAGLKTRSGTSFSTLKLACTTEVELSL